MNQPSEYNGTGFWGKPRPYRPPHKNMDKPPLIVEGEAVFHDDWEDQDIVIGDERIFAMIRTYFEIDSGSELTFDLSLGRLRITIEALPTPESDSE